MQKVLKCVHVFVKYMYSLCSSYSDVASALFVNTYFLSGLLLIAGITKGVWAWICQMYRYNSAYQTVRTRYHSRVLVCVCCLMRSSHQA